MKKITLFFALLFSLSAFSATTYLVDNGSGITWTTGGPTSGTVTKINLSTANGGSAYTLTAWLATKTFVTGDQVWIAAGTYYVSTAYTYTAVFKVYGGFAGTETATTERLKGSNAWDFTNETILSGAGTPASTTGIFTATADRVGVIFDGLTFTACGTTQALWSRAGTVQYCKFLSNTFCALASSAATSGNTATCTDSYFYNNSNSGSTSPAACISSNTTGTSNITNCTFDSNINGATTGGSSAGIKTAGTGNSVISNCIFKNNNSTAGYSSAVSFYTVTGSIANCLIYGNTGKTAIYMNGGNVYNCTVVNNTTGGAYLAPSTTTPTCNIYNSVFWGTDTNSGNITFNGVNTTGSIRNNATSSAAPAGAGLAIANHKVLPQTNTGTGAPYFIDPATNNWAITYQSALLDFGDGSISGVPTKDFLNVNRPQGGAYDIGAYEIPNFTTTITFNGNGAVDSYSTGAIIYTALGSQKSFTITANYGNQVSSVLYNGVEVIDNLIGGVYTAPAISANSTLAVTFELSTGIDMPSQQALFIVAKNTLQTKVQASVQVMTFAGAIVKNEKLNAGQAINLPTGAYIVRVTTAKGTSTQKVIL